MRQVRKSARGLEMRNTGRRITFIAKPYQIQENGTEQDISSNHSQEITLMTRNMQNLIGSADARRQ